MEPGDTVNITTKDGKSFKGVLIPSADSGVVVVKQSSGYNVPVLKKSIKKTQLVSKTNHEWKSSSTAFQAHWTATQSELFLDTQREQSHEEATSPPQTTLQEVWSNKNMLAASSLNIPKLLDARNMKPTLQSQRPIKGGCICIVLKLRVYVHSWLKYF